jgi:transposase InsO family protein
LWQADFKLCDDDYWMISYQDDHSRFIIGSVKFWNPAGENAMLLLNRAVKRFGVPRQIFTDQGTQFKPARGGISAFRRHVLIWVLSISLQAFADQLLVAKSKLSIKPTK